MDRGFDYLVSTLRKRENYKKGTHDENNNVTVEDQKQKNFSVML